MQRTIREEIRQLLHEISRLNTEYRRADIQDEKLEVKRDIRLHLKMLKDKLEKLMQHDAWHELHYNN